jgi:hypothetical protein
MASSVRSESLTIWPWSVSSFATQRFSSTIKPESFSRTDLISVAEAATRLKFCVAKSEVLVGALFCCCARSAGAQHAIRRKNAAITMKLRMFIVLWRSDS